MMEWNNDEISKLVDFVEKRSFMYVIRNFSGARNCDELASNFSCKFLVTVSVTSFWCVCRQLKLTFLACVCLSHTHTHKKSPSAIKCHVDQFAIINQPTAQY